MSKDEAFPAVLAAKWKTEGIPFKVRNAGVSGATTADVLENLDWHLADDVHTVFLCIGANDGLRGLPIAEMKANLSRIVQKALDKGIRVVLAGMKIPPNYGPKYTEAFAAIYPEIAERHGIPLMPFLLDGVAAKPALNQSDGLHPNAKGYRVVAKNVNLFLAWEGLLE